MEVEGFIDVSAILRSGVYALVHRGVVVYVGKSKVMLGRLYAHRTAWGSKSKKRVGYKPISGILFDEVWIKPCATDEIDSLEYEMINRYKPRYNAQLKNGLPAAALDLAQLLAPLLGERPPAPDPQIVTRRR